MAYLHFDNVGMAALAGAVPEFVQTIDMDPNHPRAGYIRNFVRLTGVRQRHISITEQTATDLGFAATNLALARAGWTAQDLDALVFVGQTPDFNAGTGNAYVLHNHLRMRPDAFVMDLAQGCAGFPFGLAVCGSLLQQTSIRRVVMVSGDTTWSFCPGREALLSEALFLEGEGSIALLLEDTPNSPLELALYSEGSGYNLLYNPSIGCRHAWRAKEGVLPNGAIYRGGGDYMDGLEITLFSTGKVVESIKEFFGQYGKSISDYDGVIMHQANAQILKTMARQLKVPAEKFPTTIHTLANTKVASAPLTIVNAYGAQGVIRRLLVCCFGVGLSWGIADFTLDASVVVPLATCGERFEDDFLKPLI